MVGYLFKESQCPIYSRLSLSLKTTVFCTKASKTANPFLRQAVKRRPMSILKENFSLVLGLKTIRNLSDITKKRLSSQRVRRATSFLTKRNRRGANIATPLFFYFISLHNMHNDNIVDMIRTRGIT